MNKFADLGINTLKDRNVFVVPLISIQDVVNCEIEVLDFEPNVKTRHGEGRCVVKVRHEGLEKKFFTNAEPIKEALAQVPKDQFPFTTTVKQERFGSGSGRTFYFT